MNKLQTFHMDSIFLFFLIIPGILCQRIRSIIIVPDEGNDGLEELLFGEPPAYDDLLTHNDEDAKRKICRQIINSSFITDTYHWRYVDKAEDNEDNRRFRDLCPRCAEQHYSRRDSEIVSYFTSAHTQEIRTVNMRIYRRSFACLARDDHPNAMGYPYREIYVSPTYIEDTFLIALRQNFASQQPTPLWYVGIAEMVGEEDGNHSAEERKVELDLEINTMRKGTVRLIRGMSPNRRRRICKNALTWRNLRPEDVYVSRSVPVKFKLSDGSVESIGALTCKTDSSPEETIVISRSNSRQAIYFMNLLHNGTMEPTGQLIRNIPSLNQKFVPFRQLS